MSLPIKFYTGESLKQPRTGKAARERPDPYLPDANLVKAVQLAQVLGRPLLLKGEPGCGKTKLAEAVAYELFDDQYEDYFFKWYVKSNSKAQDGLYTINHLKRLQVANQKENKHIKIDVILDSNADKGDYIELGAFGKAFRMTNTMSRTLPPPVVLIDEIDKADIDFPNDLLLELDELKFDIPEAKNEKGKPVTITADRTRKPLVIITSNNEKPLPPAFLRRCIFHYIEFPGPDVLSDIVESRKFKNLDLHSIRAAARLFSGLRSAIEKEGTASKNITTSELLDWVTVIDFYFRENKKLFTTIDTTSAATLLQKYSATLAKDEATRNMIEDAQKSVTVIGNTLAKFNEYEKTAADTPAASRTRQ